LYPDIPLAEVTDHTMASGAGVTFIFQNSDMSKHQAKNVWSGLQRGIQEIQNGNASTLRFEELYRNAYTLVLHKHGELLYDGVQRTIGEKLLRTAKEVERTTDNQLIAVMVDRWNGHKLTMTMIRDILMYMDKTYCEIKSRMPSYDLGISRFKEIVALDPKVSGRLRTELLSQIKRERENEHIDQSLMRNCLRMLVDLDGGGHSASGLEAVYEAEFEVHFLRETREFYGKESAIFLTENSVAEYLEKVEQRLSEEQQRAESYIPCRSTRQMVMRTVEHSLIGRFMKQLVDNAQSGTMAMFRNHSVNDLGRMYRLFKRIDADNALLQKAMYHFVRERGEQIVADASNAKNATKFVQSVLSLVTRFNEIVEGAFCGAPGFVRKLKEAVEYFVNLDVRSAQFLSLYTDHLLRKDAAKLSENEVGQRLDDVMQIFKYLSDKDIFEDFYKQHLASRLLHHRSHSDHHEKAMIAKLKHEMGHQYTSKLEGMFKDIAQSRQLHTQWMQYCGDNTSDRVVLETKVLTTGTWPIQQVGGQAITLPPALETVTKRFRRFYCDGHSGRRLAFDTSRGSAEVRVQFDCGPKDLVCHTMTMGVLLLFNDKDEWRWGDMLRALGVDKKNEESLSRHVLALAHPKVRVLCKTPNVRRLDEGHTFKFNAKYTNQRVRVQIGVLQDSRSKAVNQSQSQNPVPHQVLEARKNRVEAAIVRIMKARKQLHHQQLIVEVVHQLQSRFNPDPPFIKQRVASLLEREYLERDRDDRRLYHYMA